MIYRRIDNSDQTQWTVVLPNALTIYHYKMPHISTKFTPADARQNKNQLDVKLNMELHRVQKKGNTQKLMWAIRSGSIRRKTNWIKKEFQHGLKQLM